MAEDTINIVRKGLTPNFFEPLLISGNCKAPRDLIMHIIFFESHTQGSLDFCLTKSITAFLRYFSFTKSTPVLLHKVVFQPFFVTINSKEPSQ